MDPNTGRLYADLTTARLSGVENPVELTGRPEDVQRISEAVAELHRRELTAKEKAARKARNKAARQARRASR
jgi:hypothetical protein